MKPPSLGRPTPEPISRPVPRATLEQAATTATPSAAPPFARAPSAGGRTEPAVASARRRVLAELILLGLALAADLWWLRGLWTKIPSLLCHAVIVGLVLLSIRRRHGSLRRALAARRQGLRAWVGPALFTLAAGAAIAGLGALLRTEPHDEIRLFALSWPPEQQVRAALSTIGRALWQQAGLFGLVWPASRLLLGPGGRAMALSAGFFAACHLPHPGFTAATFLVAWCWVALYRRGGAFLALLASHALLSVWTFAQLPERTLHDLHVGSKAVARGVAYRSLSTEANRRLLGRICDPDYLSRFSSHEAYVEAIHPRIFDRAATPEEIAVWAEKARRRSRKSAAKMMVMYRATLDSAAAGR